MCSGEYSDFGICSVFSSEEKAQDYIDEMEFASTYDENYRIQTWEIDEVPIEVPTNDMCLFNGKVVRLDDLNKEFENEGYVAFCIFSDLRENAKSRVLEITKEDYLNGLLNNNWGQDEVDIEKVQFPIYCVQDVKYDKNKEVINKVVYDEIARYKAEKENI